VVRTGAGFKGAAACSTGREIRPADRVPRKAQCLTVLVTGSLSIWTKTAFPLDKIRLVGKKSSNVNDEAAMTDDVQEATVTQADEAEPVRAAPKEAAPAPAPVPASMASSPAPASEINTAIRDTIFERLVSSDGDVIGLLAYSLSKQNKRDWLAAFRKVKGRDPDTAELDAFDIGETIDRRIGTYRKLAEVAINGDPFWASSTVTPVSEMTAAPPTATPEQAVSPVPEASMASFSPPPKAKEGWFIKRR
jgi:hypothetical protein